MPRIAPLEPPFAPEVARWLDKWMVPGVEVEPLALFRLLAVHPELADRCRPMAAGLLTKGLLPARDREIVIGRTTARAGAEYEWGVHRAVFGPVVDPEGSLFDRLATEPPGTTAFDGRTNLLVAAVDELCDTATISAATWTGLADHYDDRRLIELVLLCGWYRTLSTLINAVGLPLEPWAVPNPASGRHPVSRRAEPAT